MANLEFTEQEKIDAEHMVANALNSLTDSENGGKSHGAVSNTTLSNANAVSMEYVYTHFPDEIVEYNEDPNKKPLSPHTTAKVQTALGEKRVYERFLENTLTREQVLDLAREMLGYAEGRTPELIGFVVAGSRMKTDSAVRGAIRSKNGSSTFIDSESSDIDLIPIFKSKDPKCVLGSATVENAVERAYLTNHFDLKVPLDIQPELYVEDLILDPDGNLTNFSSTKYNEWVMDPEALRFVGALPDLTEEESNAYIARVLKSPQINELREHKLARATGILLGKD